MSLAPSPPAVTFKQKVIAHTAAAVRGCMLVYPVGKKAKQRVALGDSTGLFKVFSVGKRLEPIVAFETPETVVPAGTPDRERKMITTATLYTDQLFFVQGSVLHAYSRKGKAFFTVDTNVTERVNALAIDTPFIFLAGDFMVTTMKETKETGFYLSPDRVNDMCVYAMPSTSAKTKGEEHVLEDYMCCLACNDRVLRLIQANKLLEEVSCEASLTTLLYDAQHRLVFYGTQSGSIGVLAVKDNGSLARVGSLMPGSSSTTSVGNGGGSAASPIASFGLADVNANGAEELLVGYDDGTVCVFAVQHSTDAATSTHITGVQLSLLWSSSVGERVMSVAGGNVTNASAEQPDVLVHTFSGQVIAFTLDVDAATKQVDAAAAAAETAAQQTALLAKQHDTQTEMEQLRTLISRKTEELRHAPVAKTSATAAPPPPVLSVSAASTFKLIVSLTPLEGTPMLSLVLQADVPLSGVALRCSAALTFLSTESAVVKTRACAAASPVLPSSAAMATITPTQEGGRRVEVHLWVDEGVADTLHATAFSAQAPRTAQVKFIPLYALPLYERISANATVDGAGSTPTSPLAPEVTQAMSRWIVLGNFLGSDVLEWMGQLLPDLADIPHAATAQRHVFVSDFLKSTLIVEVDEMGPEAGEEGNRAVFSCNSLVSLATVKRHILGVCAQRGVNITTREHVLFQTALRQLQMLYPVMSSLSSSQRRWQLVQGLRELQGSEGDLGFVPNHLQELLASAEEIQAEAEAETHQEAYLKRAVCAIYRSLVYFKAHAVPFNEAIKSRLLSASCGLGFDTAVLERLMFPRDEQLQEVAALELASGGGGGSTGSPATTTSPVPVAPISDMNVTQPVQLTESLEAPRDGLASSPGS